MLHNVIVLRLYVGQIQLDTSKTYQREVSSTLRCIRVEGVGSLGSGELMTTATESAAKIYL